MKRFGIGFCRSSLLFLILLSSCNRQCDVCKRVAPTTVVNFNVDKDTVKLEIWNYSSPGNYAFASAYVSGNGQLNDIILSAVPYTTPPATINDALVVYLKQAISTNTDLKKR